VKKPKQVNSDLKYLNGLLPALVEKKKKIPDFLTPSDNVPFEESSVNVWCLVQLFCFHFLNGFIHIFLAVIVVRANGMGGRWVTFAWKNIEPNA
jgi:hypothetical protein